VIVVQVTEAMEVDIPNLLKQVPGMKGNDSQQCANPFEMNAAPNIAVMMDDDKAR